MKGELVNRNIGLLYFYILLKTVAPVFIPASFVIDALTQYRLYIDLYTIIQNSVTMAPYLPV